MTNPLRLIAVCVVALCVLGLADDAHAQRSLHWDSIDVEARLDADGRLHVTETQTVVFSGDWNGGERRFNIRPRQRFEFSSLYRSEGDGWKALVRDSSLDDVDDYAFTDDTTLRWRSRLPNDPPFTNTAIKYVLQYELSNILLKDGDAFTLDHDFLFPDRDGVIARASVVLTLDPDWQPQTAVRERYTAEQVPPGRGLVLTIPLRYTGAGTPMVIDTRLAPRVIRGLWSLLFIPIAVVAWTFAREHWYGRFAPLQTGIDEEWIREHIVKHPAEVVAAAWDNHIESAEVVALIARLVAEGKLKSTARTRSMSLTLVAERDSFDGYERALIDALFFNKRSDTTSTELIKQHYRKKGFDPSEVIRKALQARAAAILPPGRMPFVVPYLATAIYAGGAVMLAREWLNGRITTTAAALFIVGALALMVLARRGGLIFRANVQWGAKMAAGALVPGVVAIAVGAIYLWRWADRGEVPATDGLVVGVVMATLSVLFAGVGGLKSTQHRAALAFRKMLASGREYFIAELKKEQPALRDEWFPWVLAFGLGKQMDDWSATRASTDSPTRSSVAGATSTFSGGSSSPSTWTGFGGGRSGGAGAGASWTAAVSSLAAPIAPPSSSGSSGGSSSSSSGGGGGGSSGGGGGGGW